MKISYIYENETTCKGTHAWSFQVLSKKEHYLERVLFLELIPWPIAKKRFLEIMSHRSYTEVVAVVSGDV